MKKTIIIDLDGTLLKTNTFEHYILFVVKTALKRIDIRTVFLISILVLLRKVRLISTHEKMKYHILKGTASYATPQRMRELATLLEHYENMNVFSLKESFKEKNYVTILSTAAPMPYAKIISEDFGFDHCSASEMPLGKEWKENVNEQKKKNTLNMLNSFNGELCVFVTDHYDDLPLLRLPKECNYVVNPSDKTKKYLDDNNIEYRLL